MADLKDLLDDVSREETSGAVHRLTPIIAEVLTALTHDAFTTMYKLDRQAAEDGRRSSPQTVAQRASCTAETRIGEHLRSLLIRPRDAEAA